MHCFEFLEMHFLLFLQCEKRSAFNDYLIKKGEIQIPFGMKLWRVLSCSLLMDYFTSVDRKITVILKYILP